MDTNQQSHPNREYPDLPADAIDGTVREAMLAADLLCDFLEAHRLLAGTGEQSDPLPLGAALQLAAALRLQQWEDRRFRDHLPADLPSAESTLVDALLMLRKGPSSALAKTSGQSLARKCFVAWLRGFSWSARAELGIDVLLTGPERLSDDDHENLANLLWHHRHSEFPAAGGN